MELFAVLQIKDKHGYSKVCNSLTLDGTEATSSQRCHSEEKLAIRPVIE